MSDLSLTGAMGALVPDDAFRHELETKRNLAIAREEILVTQINALNADLTSVKRVIARCEAALFLEEPMLAEQAPAVVVTKPAAPNTPPETATSEELQAAIANTREPAKPPIPGFLLEPKTAPALEINGAEH